MLDGRSVRDGCCCLLFEVKLYEVLSASCCWNQPETLALCKHSSPQGHNSDCSNFPKFQPRKCLSAQVDSVHQERVRKQRHLLLDIGAIEHWGFKPSPFETSEPCLLSFERKMFFLDFYMGLLKHSMKTCPGRRPTVGLGDYGCNPPPKSLKSSTEEITEIISNFKTVILSFLHLNI